ncbi:hypothetical protein [Marinoscillum furvescens]|uniref:PKD domain-containing protein n=1 Tax=Marinoscillum furvescens DSM 4134 TaxID=1122208 RepID=A0A3D9L4G2_MARFU|nr:hypothetical protein [Marinoscillum furvescens]RED99817.1 hypothetical protein C7460_10799 [Marinoscillum furvescens DSM 4134]
MSYQKLKKNIGLGVLAAFTLVGCVPEDEELSLGEQPEATFMVEAVAGQNNTYVLTNTTPGAFVSVWDKGSGFEKGREMDTIFLPDRGTYDIQLVAVTSGGADTSAVQTINVETSDPAAGNLVVGGRMNAEDADHWTLFTISDGVAFEMVEGKMRATGGGWGHAGFYQAVQVEANKPYQFGATVSGSGASDTWFEVYFGRTEPQSYQDYSDGGVQLALNTWAGCATTSFNGSLLSVGCEGALRETNGVITFDEGGTIYLVVKTGGGDLGAEGIAIDNLELRGTK